MEAFLQILRCCPEIFQKILNKSAFLTRIKSIYNIITTAPFNLTEKFKKSKKL